MVRNYEDGEGPEWSERILIEIEIEIEIERKVLFV